MTTTYQALADFIDTANNWLTREGPTAQHDSKLKWAVQRVLKRGARIIDDFREQVADIEINHCAVDEKGHIMRNQFGLVFTPENRIKANQDVRALRKQSVEIEPYIATDTDGIDITDLEREAFTGFVLEAKG